MCYGCILTTRILHRSRYNTQLIIAIGVRNWVNLARKFWKQISVHLPNFHTLRLARVRPACKIYCCYNSSSNLGWLYIWLENITVWLPTLICPHTLSHCHFLSVKRKAGSECWLLYWVNACAECALRSRAPEWEIAKKLRACAHCEGTTAKSSR